MPVNQQSGLRLLTQPWFWGVSAVLALLSLTGILISQHDETRQRFSVFLAANPAQGEAVFREKGCVNCHSVNGRGGTVGPDLGRKRPDHATIAQLVTAMWNHAPKMWERMRVEKVSYPSLTHEETARLVAYLYMSRHVDPPGNAEHGSQLFQSKECIRCHAINGQGGRIGPDLAQVPGLDSPVAFTRELWNHASAMQVRMQELGITWPEFEGHDLNDLFAYRQAASPQSAPGSAGVPGDPERGWKVFQDKACMSCHSVEGEDRVGPSLGAKLILPGTFLEVGGLMLSHSPKMQRAMEAQQISRPRFDGDEMADLVAFLYSLRYTEPAGSPYVGESIFTWRGCSRCHGGQAQGTDAAPTLRGRGQNYNSIALATALWRHGNGMYYQTKKMGVSWPTLIESDVGDLLAYLNSPVRPLAARK